MSNTKNVEFLLGLGLSAETIIFTYVRQVLSLCYFGAPDLLVRRSRPALLVAVVMIMAVLKRSRFPSSALSFRCSGLAPLVAVVTIMDAALELRSGN